MSDPGKELLASVSSLLGPARAELGEMIADRVRLWRWQRALKIIDRANEIRRSKPSNTTQISLKFFLPFIEEASKEDNDDLSEWWSRLLASSSDQTSGFYQVCTELLKHMGGQEAEYLNRISKFAKENEAAETLMEMIPNRESFCTSEFIEQSHDQERIYLTAFRRKGWPQWEKEYESYELQALISLQKLGLIVEKDFPLYYTNDNLDRYDVSYFALSRLGEAFLTRITR